jgi:hypothetical protein
LYIQRPFFKPLCLFALWGGGCSFPSPMPAERRRNPPKPGARVQTRVRPGAGPRPRVQGRARFALDPRDRVQGRARFDLDTKRPSPRGSPICFLDTKSPSPRGSPILVFDTRTRVQGGARLPLDLRPKSPMDSRARSKTKRALCASLAPPDFL